MPYISDEEYFSTPSEYGGYQYVSLADVVNNFMLMYVGDDKLIANVDRYNILFHAKRGIQELNYDAGKNIKVLELDVDDSISFVLPPDYVNYARISMEVNGVLYTLTEDRVTNFARAYLKDANNEILYDSDGNALLGSSELDKKRILGHPRTVFNGNGWAAGRWGYYVDGFWYFTHNMGGYYGMNTENANINPTFRVDKEMGMIHFSSDMSGRKVVLEYISDGLENGDDTKVMINKLAEDYLYAYIMWCLVKNRLGVQEYIVRRYREEKSALLRNAKIRMSNLHSGRLLMALRGKDNWIK